MAEKIALVIRDRWVDGRPVYEVPIIQNIPRCPVGGGTFYYTPDYARCAVAATKTAASYLAKRHYAKYVGIAKYDANDGIGYFEWQPETEAS